ncbi:hypothetical protein H0H81_004440 [Sphagnurus paluster]|uniref:TauD/TfdA-like domain-containing protein n=1 Tax=Sphagnurus paluster TaxID=117069 RepID=A0A9P7K5V2_9AGAR|nr:hypothetical protein H0H81_004440 [Sphagnurus paluster]
MFSTPTSFLGSLNIFDSFDNTPIIGTTFSNKSTQLSQLLAAPNSDELIEDLATLISHRGVVFFSEQDLTIEQQKQLATRLGELSGKPATSKLHVHPISEETPELSADISVISSMGHAGVSSPSYFRSHTLRGWHSDITFENVPSDYAAYDRLSPPYQKFLEGLTAVHHADSFIEYAARNNIKMNDNRGSPENTGTSLTAIHPVIRTNPVTGFKSVFVNREFTKRIVELSPEESDATLQFLQLHISENHDLQVRYRWKTNDIAIWDNRSTLHTATQDYGDKLRVGHRVVSIGERPYFDPNSKSRRAALGDLRNVVPEL